MCAADSSPISARKRSGMLVREMQHDASADRAAHGDRLVELERVGDFDDHAHIVARGELVFGVLPAGGRRGLAVPGHVEGDDAEMFASRAHRSSAPRYWRASEPAVCRQSRGMPWPGFLDIKPVRLAEQIEMQIAAGDWLEARAHRMASRCAAPRSRP